MAEIWLTAEEIKKREERLEYLKGPRRLEIAEMLKTARRHQHRRGAGAA